MLIKDLLEAIAASKPNAAVNLYNQLLEKGGDPWEIHMSLFTAAQTVLNPPYINPHLPKMYGVIREFLPYLKKEDLPALVRLEIGEYARRPKLKIPVQRKGQITGVSFSDIETAIGYQDIPLTATNLLVFMEAKGLSELSRSLLLLGTGYLHGSLGHSVSCTGFILLELLFRQGGNPWPALVCLAHYFCKGRFDSMPSLDFSKNNHQDDTFEAELIRAATGYGIVNLHHTITFYSIARIRHLFDRDEFRWVVQAGVDFMGIKTKGDRRFHPADSPPADYDRFQARFSEKRPDSLIPLILAMTNTAHSRKRLGRFLIKGVCNHYRGDYNPHFLTGLGSTLWIIENYWRNPDLVAAASNQYLNFFFDGLS